MFRTFWKILALNPSLGQHSAPNLEKKSHLSFNLTMVFTFCLESQVVPLIPTTSESNNLKNPHLMSHVGLHQQ